MSDVGKPSWDVASPVFWARLSLMEELFDDDSERTLRDYFYSAAPENIVYYLPTIGPRMNPERTLDGLFMNRYASRVEWLLANGSMYSQVMP